MGDVGKAIGSVFAPVADIATAVFAPELLPLVAPAAGAIGGGITGGAGGALTGGLEGLIGGQLAGTGELAPLSSAGAGDATGVFGLGSTGSESLIGQGLDALGGVFSPSSDVPSVSGNVASTGTGASPAGVGASTPTVGTGGASAAATTNLPGVASGGNAPIGDLTAPSTQEIGFNEPSAPSNVLQSLSTLQGTDPNAVPSLDAIAGTPSSGGTFDIQSQTPPGIGFIGGTPGTVQPTGVSGVLNDLGLGGTPTPASGEITGPQPLGTDSIPGITAPTGGAASTAATGPSSVSKFLSNPGFSTAGNVIASNPGTALGALGLGYSAINAGTMPKGTNALTSEANSLATQGNTLAQSLNGPLPPAATAALNEASNSAKAQVRSQYANLGLTGSTMEAEALAGVDQTVAAQGFQIADQLYQQGVSEANISSQLFQQIMAIQAGQNNALTGAVGNFAAALAGGSNPKAA